MEEPLKSPVVGPEVGEIAGWSSLWADLLLVEMTLHAREGMRDNADNLFARRALWEAAVTGYYRTANTGRRQQQVTELLETLDSAAIACHEEIKDWRNKHVAHRADELRESVDVRLLLDEDGRPMSSEVRVAPVLGPEQEGSDLAKRALGLVRRLKDAVWEARIAPLEAKILRNHADKSQELLEAAESAPSEESPHFAITIAPTGVPST